MRIWGTPWRADFYRLRGDHWYFGGGDMTIPGLFSVVLSRTRPRMGPTMALSDDLVQAVREAVDPWPLIWPTIAAPTALIPVAGVATPRPANGS